MNRQKKSSVILILVVIVLSPLVYKAYQFSKKLDKKDKQMEVLAENMMTETKTKMQKTLIGKWARKDNQESWNFISDSTVIIDNINYNSSIEMNILIIERAKPQMIMCVIENDSTLKMIYVKTEVKDFFGKQDFFQLIKE